MSKKYDAIIIGGGHNGLINAAYLAKAGKEVLVLEKRHVLGGAAVSEEIYPGFTFSVCSYVVSLFRPILSENYTWQNMDMTSFQWMPHSSHFLTETWACADGEMVRARGEKLRDSAKRTQRFMVNSAR